MGFKQQLKLITSSFFDIIYPNNCSICQTHLNHNENYLCLNCKYDLPFIYESSIASIALQKIFWGRVDVEHVYSLLNYQKGNQTQTILHELKYNGKTKLALHFGEMLGQALSNDDTYDYLIPVPLHPKKLRKRGYNQSAKLAEGIQNTTPIPLKPFALSRLNDNTSQTQHSKYDRWENVSQIFKVDQPDQFKNKHIVLVDDVLTTGATVEACVNELQKIDGCKVSVATLAARI